VGIDHFILCSKCQESAPTVGTSAGCSEPRWMPDSLEVLPAFIMAHLGHPIELVHESDPRAYLFEQWDDETFEAMKNKIRP